MTGVHHLRHVAIVSVLGLALSCTSSAASADQCSQATAIAMRKLQEAVSLSTVLKPNDASNPIMCRAAHRVLNAYIQHLTLLERRQIQCRSLDPNAIRVSQISVERIKAVVVPRYCQ